MWSDLLEWGRIRQRGKKRFIWLCGVLWWAAVIGLGWSLGMFLFGDQRSVLVLLLTPAIFAICGYLYGRVQWRFAERQYQTSMQAGYFNLPRFRRPAHW
jgi:hypothetical protein